MTRKELADEVRAAVLAERRRLAAILARGGDRALAQWVETYDDLGNPPPTKDTP